MKGWRVAVLGNSHAAALKLGWDEAGGAIPGIASLTVFARPNGAGGLDGLKLRGRLIEAGNEELRQCFAQTAGLEHIELDCFDAFLLHSFGPLPKSIYDAAESLDGHHYSAAFMSVWLGEYRQALKARFAQSPYRLLCRLLRRGTNAPIYATHKPLFGEGMPGSRRGLRAGPLVLEAYQGAAREALTVLDCQLLCQPQDTIADGCFSAARYTRSDFKHMNAGYGELVLRELAAELGKRTG